MNKPPMNEEKQQEMEIPASRAWERPSRSRRMTSAFVDLLVWTAIWLLLAVSLSALVHRMFGIAIPTGSDTRDTASVICSGIGALSANLYLAISNGAGRSIGKAVTGLRLAVRSDHHMLTPGFARGLLRSSLQAGPWMGALMVLTGWHDAVAGTTIARFTEIDIQHSSRSEAARCPRIAAWKIMLATLLHGFFGFVYVVISAI